VRSGRGRLGLAVALLLAVVVGVFLTTRVPPAEPFGVDSSAPNGWKAVRLLLEGRGVRVEEASAASLAGGERPLREGEAVVVAVPSVATEAQVRALADLAAGGGTVVFGEQPLGAEEAEFSALIDAELTSGRELADAPASPSGPGRCDIEALEGLGPIDTAFAVAIDPGSITPADAERRCYADGLGAHVVERTEGAGRVVSLSSPFLWVNARLQPNKEQGGGPLANGAVAVRLLGDASVVTFVDPAPSATVAFGGTQDPLTLLPLPVKLALAQLAGAFVLYLWWRSRRLGPPIPERLPVEIAGSELVVAVGDLLRRRGNAQRAAATVRAETRRVLGERLGLGPHGSHAALVEVVATRTGRDPAELAAVLFDDPAAPVTSAEALVTLVRTLDTIRQEVLHVDVHTTGSAAPPGRA
jgi:hypothetical protein